MTLGVGTTVHLDGRLYGKPEGADEAARMLRQLSGRTHTVLSGLCLLGPDFELVHHEVTDVTFRLLTRLDVDVYLESGEWRGRAGAYAIQGLGGRLVERIDGDYLNVVGLPGALLVTLLERNNRFPSFAGDLAAMIGGVQLSVKRLQAVLRKWGTEVVKAAINYNIDHTEKRMRDEVARWPDGSYEATVFIDHDTVGTKDVKVHVTCTIKGNQLTVDLNSCKLTDATGLVLPFVVDESRRHCLLNGLDDIALTLQHETKIAAFEQTRGMQPV